TRGPGGSAARAGPGRRARGGIWREGNFTRGRVSERDGRASAMSASTGANPFAIEPAAETTSGRWAKVDAVVSQLSERLKPILVQEARQAMNSKQFSITFTLVLFFGWPWSMFGVSLFGPSVYYGAEGPGMFIGYFPILAFPLLIIVPVGAFWSLVEERQDW